MKYLEKRKSTKNEKMADVPFETFEKQVSRFSDMKIIYFKNDSIFFLYCLKHFGNH